VTRLRRLLRDPIGGVDGAATIGLGLDQAALYGFHGYHTDVPEMNRRSMMSTCAIAVLAAAVHPAATRANGSPLGTDLPPAPAGFVTRDPTTGNLMLNGQRFRWGGPNIPTAFGLSQTDSAYGAPLDADALHLSSHAEITAAFDSARAMNAGAIRALCCLTVGKVNSIQPSAGVFNADAFEPIDYAISLCGGAGIKLIFPLADNYQYYHGGKFWYCTANGVTPDSVASQFFTDETVIDSFKAYISLVLNHINRYTGIAYKDDPVILAWETGNELTVSPDPWTLTHLNWTEDIAQYIKVTLGAQQLVIDGHTDLDNIAAYDLGHVDIYTTHTYHNALDPSWVVVNAETIHSHGKAFFLGEYSWTDRDIKGFPLSWTVSQMLSAIEASPYVDGDNFWSLYPPLANWGGGFTLHYPGDNGDMVTRATQLANHALAMQSAKAPPAFIAVTE
jgi:mannan endo-1,4-beta-mannosidase